ncbi:MAG TPA: hypothetical protein VM677_34630 [Actinokineospora sp.]|nr:hypothetical protein [Actinokineospora sp.]
MNLARTLGTGVALAAAALVIATPMASADSQPSSTVTVSPAPSTVTSKPAPTAPPKPQVVERPKGAPETGGGPAETSDLAVWVIGAAGAATVGAGGLLALRRRRVTN